MGRHKKKIFIGTLLLIVAIFSLYYVSLTKVFLQEFDVKRLEEVLSQKDIDAFSYIRENIKSIVEVNGIEATVSLVEDSFRKNQMSFYHCHTLAHIIGHESFTDVVGSIATVKRVDYDFCGGGFVHGIEAEIALRGLYEGREFRNELYDFCREMKRISDGDCYHGAGHEFLSQTKDPEKALSLCDTLTGGPEKDLSYCYLGVFSDYTNILGGTDGETGYELTGGPPFSIDVHPVEYCMSFEEKYQEPCVYEVSGLGNDDYTDFSAVSKEINECINPRYPRNLQTVCIHSIGGVTAQHMLYNRSTMYPPSNLIALDGDLRRAYIGAAATQMAHYIKDGQGKDWMSFCKAFPISDFEYCESHFVTDTK